MHILRRVLTFWLTCVLLVAGFAAWETWLLGRSEPDFGAPLGNFAMVLGVYSLLALPAALCHGIAAFLLRKTLVSSSPASAAGVCDCLADISVDHCHSEQTAHQTPCARCLTSA